MKSPLLLAGILLACTLTVEAQDGVTPGNFEYRTAVGIRLGPNSPAISTGITLKHFLDERHALEGILGLTNGVGICGLYEWHHAIPSVDKLQWFIGAGGFLAFRDSETLLGAAGIVGLDYKFPEIPLNLTLDWKPELNFINDVGYDGTGIGLSVRFTIN